MKSKKSAKTNEDEAPASGASKARIFLALLFASFILFLAGAGFLFHLGSPPGVTDRERAAFSIEKGESVGEIADALEAQGFIRAGWLLKLFTRLRGSENLFQSGSYMLARDQSVWDLHEYFITGKQHQVKVTIPEGWTASKIGRHLEEAGISRAADFLAASTEGNLLREFGLASRSVEGFLFPDTYFFPEGFPVERIIAHMIRNFFARMRPVLSETPAMTKEELYRRVTLGSIIEREYRSADEAPLMASVFLNRLKLRMHLGSCATVEYIITEIEKKPHPDFLTYKDLEIESEYNTYLKPGLPPAPISNPGLTALKAAFKPAGTDYLYFVLKDPQAGRHFFSRSLDEHERAKFIYLKRNGS